MSDETATHVRASSSRPEAFERDTLLKVPFGSESYVLRRDMLVDYWVFGGILFANEYGSLRLRGDDILLDVGANIGITTVHLGRRCRRVIAVEPDPSNFELLEYNVRNNGLANAVLVRKAASDSEYDTYVTGEGGLAHLGDSGSLVQASTLDAIVKDSGSTNPTVLKMDIEGGEARALQGFSKYETLREGVIEVHSKELLVKVRTILESNGFSLEDVSRISPLNVVQSVLLHPISFAVGEWSYRFEITRGVFGHIFARGPHPVAASNPGSTQYVVHFVRRSRPREPDPLNSNILQSVDARPL